MSVIKKYNTGGKSGKTAPNTWRASVGKQISSLKLSKDAEAQLRNETEKLALLYEAEGDNIHNIFSEKPNLATYSVNIDNMTNEEMKAKGAEYWSGSQKEIRPNLFGKIKSKGEEGEKQMQGLAASLFVDHLNLNKPKIAEETTKERIGISDVTSYVQKKNYPGRESFKEDFKKGKTLEEMRSGIKLASIQTIEAYKKQALENPDFDYSDLDQAQKVLDILNTEGSSWEDYQNAAFKLKWTPNQLAMSEEEIANKKASDEQKVKADEEAAKLAAHVGVRDTLLEANFSPELAEGLGSKYTKMYNFSSIPEDFKDFAPNIQGIMENKNAFLLENDQGHRILVNPKIGLFKHDYKRPGSEQLGNKIFHTEAGALTYLKPGDEGYVPFNFSAEGNAYQEIEGTVEGYDGWKILGVPEGDTPNYADTIIIVDPKTKKEIELIRIGKDKYKNRSTGEELITNLTDFGVKGPELPFNFIKENLGIFHASPEIEVSEAEIPALLEEIKKIEDIKNPEEGNTWEYMTTLFGKLKYIINNKDLAHIISRDAGDLYRKFDFHFLENQTKEITDKDKVLKRNILEEIERIINPASIKPKSTYHRVMEAPRPRGMYKKGGSLSKIKSTVKKMQRGGYAMTSDDYKKAREAKKTSVEKEAIESNTLRNITGSLADMSLAEKISLGGAAASAIPVLGAVGATVSTIADLYEDLKDGHLDHKLNHLANLGFIAISAAGFGGLKTAQSAYKVGKVVAKATSIGKKGLPMLSKIDDVAQLRKLKSIGTKLKKVEGAGSFKNAKVTTSEFQLFKDLGFVKNNTSITTGIKKGLGKELGEALKAPHLKKLRAPTAIEREFSGTIGFVKGAIPELAKVRTVVGEGLKYSGLGLMGANVAMSGYDVVKGLSQDGLAGVEVMDAKNLLYAFGGARGYLKNMQKGKAAMSLLKGEEKTLLAGTGKTAKSFKLKKDLEVPTLEKIGKLDKVKGWTKSSKEKVVKLKEVNKVKLDKFKKEIADITGGTSYDKAIDAGDLSAFKISTRQTGVKTLKESGMSTDAYNRAISDLKGNWTSGVAIPKFMRNLPKTVKDYKFKDGGNIQKLEYGGGVKQPTTYDSRFKGVKFDKLQTLQTLKFGLSALSNSKIRPINARAVEARRVQLPLSKRVNLSISSSSNEPYNKKANELEATSRRIGSATSDIDKSIGAQLTGAKYGADYRLQGKMAHLTHLDSLRKEQLGYDVRADQLDAQINAQNISSNALANQKQHLNIANYEQVKAANLSDYIDTWGRKVQKDKLAGKEYEKTKTMLGLRTDDVYKDAYDAYKTTSAPTFMAGEKELWEKQFKGTDSTVRGVWEDSDEYAAAKAKHAKNLGNWTSQQNIVTTLSSILQNNPSLTSDQLEEMRTTTSSIFKSGGSLSLGERKKLENKKSANKIILEDVKAKHKIHLKSIELAIKNIALSDKFLQKSLHKIFKDES